MGNIELFKCTHFNASSGNLNLNRRFKTPGQGIFKIYEFSIWNNGVTHVEICAVWLEKSVSDFVLNKNTFMYLPLPRVWQQPGFYPTYPCLRETQETTDKYVNLVMSVKNVV